MTEFRTSIYAQYSTVMQDRGEILNTVAARRWGRAYDHFIGDWLPRKKSAAIADVACGSGQLLLFLKDRGFTAVTGCDVSPPQVRLARQVVDSVALQDATEFVSARPGAFDLITGLDIIEHLTREEAVPFLRGCLHSLRPGGRLILQTPNLESPMGSAVRYGDCTHEVGYTADSLGRMLRFAGFDEISPRELGPVRRGYSVAASLRYIAWRVLRCGIGLYNSIETGDRGSGVYTRVFLISGRKS